MQLLLGKNSLKINEYGCLPNFELQFKFLENLRKPLTLKSTENALTCESMMASPVSRQGELNPALWLASRAGKMVLSYSLGIIHRVPQENGVIFF